MLNRMPVIGCMADNGHYLYAFGTLNLYLPFPNPLTASIKSAFFQFCNEITGGSNRITCNGGYIGTSKDTINAHACEYHFCFFNRSLACVPVRQSQPQSQDNQE